MPRQTFSYVVTSDTDWEGSYVYGASSNLQSAKVFAEGHLGQMDADLVEDWRDGIEEDTGNRYWFIPVLGASITITRYPNI